MSEYYFRGRCVRAGLFIMALLLSLVAFTHPLHAENSQSLVEEGVRLKDSKPVLLLANGQEVDYFWVRPKQTRPADEDLQATIAVKSPLREKNPPETIEEEILEEASPAYWMPVPNSAELTSPFGVRPNPFDSETEDFHLGIDFADAPGSPVTAVQSGIVIRAESFDSYGLCIDIEHPDGLISRYAHLDAIHVELGQSVSAGQLIGDMGSSGAVTGPHLHFEIHLFGQQVDPAPYLGIPVEEQAALLE